MRRLRCTSCRGTGDINEDTICLTCSGTGVFNACDQYLVDDHTCDLPIDHEGPCAYQPALFDLSEPS